MLIGWPFVMFGDGEICKCNPIAESDLAAYMLDCIDGLSICISVSDGLTLGATHTVYMHLILILTLSPCIDPNKWNRVLNVGGPDEGMTMKQQVSEVELIM